MQPGSNTNSDDAVGANAKFTMQGETAKFECKVARAASKRQSTTRAKQKATPKQKVKPMWLAKGPMIPTLTTNMKNMKAEAKIFKVERSNELESKWPPILLSLICFRSLWLPSPPSDP